jgi:hypothetical protein
MNNEQINSAAGRIEKLAAQAEHGDPVASKLLADAFGSIKGSTDLLAMNDKLNKDLGGFGGGAHIDTDRFGTPTGITFFPSIADRATGLVTGKPAQNAHIKLHDQNYCLVNPCI